MAGIRIRFVFPCSSRELFLSKNTFQSLDLGQPSDRTVLLVAESFWYCYGHPIVSRPVPDPMGNGIFGSVSDKRDITHRRPWTL